MLQLECMNEGMHECVKSQIQRS